MKGNGHFWRSENASQHDFRLLSGALTLGERDN
jgi:hypothetical protein